MELTYTISEREYVRATKLRKRAPAVKWLAFGVFVVLCLLLLLWRVVQVKSGGDPQSTEDSTALSTNSENTASHAAERPEIGRALLVNVVPFLFFAALWIYLIALWPRRTLKRMYRRDPSMRGEFKVNLTHESISIQNTAGTDSQMKWSLFEYWRESKDLIVLVYRNGAFFPISLARLSEPEKVEARAVLAGSVPQL